MMEYAIQLLGLIVFVPIEDQNRIPAPMPKDMELKAASMKNSMKSSLKTLNDLHGNQMRIVNNTIQTENVPLAHILYQLY
ncbi:hypothetical protein COB11_00665 [Candidatus Aerophobetes bacterium]|uniref:Uncharacterized protein n=1 Tax=Aerophobetes bacterium TaxID=2030807 RepID=A0A2A4YNR1_UNCAE|nr:MAG: hypothetical protein COB11_00665 [Candidatus Aerophobetes bacterium]